MSNATERKARMFSALAGLGISHADALQLRRIQLTLRSWGERECGDVNGRAIERDENTGKPFMTYEIGNGKRGRSPIADREAGALKRLAAIMAAYPALVPYHQTDPRGCALYIVRRSDIGKGMTLDSVYTRGVAVCE